MSRVLRGIQILRTVGHYRLDTLLGDREGSAGLRRVLALNPWRINGSSGSDGERLRKALEDLGPVFIKFGQMLSTRRDLLPVELADELAEALGNR